MYRRFYIERPDGDLWLQNENNMILEARISDRGELALYKAATNEVVLAFASGSWSQFWIEKGE